MSTKSGLKTKVEKAHKLTPTVSGFWMTQEDSFLEIAKIWIRENICAADGITSPISRSPSSVRWVIEVETGYLPSVATVEAALTACGYPVVDHCRRRRIKFSTIRARQVYQGKY